MDDWYDKEYWDRGVHYLAGVDEAGRGPLAGPVVAAAVILPPYFIIDGLRDSKKMQPKERERVFLLLQKHAVDIAFEIITHDDIDRINILQATLTAMKSAVSKLTCHPGFILVDGNKIPDWSWKSKALVKGDSLSHTIAAASVIAKVTRDRLMVDFDSQYPDYKFARHKGYATRAHIEAIRKFGLSPIHRRSFCRKILAADSQTSILEFNSIS